jgi:hypothetical protein
MEARERKDQEVVLLVQEENAFSVLRGRSQDAVVLALPTRSSTTLEGPGD